MSGDTEREGYSFFELVLILDRFDDDSNLVLGDDTGIKIVDIANCQWCWFWGFKRSGLRDMLLFSWDFCYTGDENYSGVPYLTLLVSA